MPQSEKVKQVAELEVRDVCESVVGLIHDDEWSEAARQLGSLAGKLGIAFATILQYGQQDQEQLDV